MKNLKILITAILICTGSIFELAAQDVGYVPTRTPVLNAMLRLADVQPTDVVYDLGSGDGRIVIAAAQEYGAGGWELTSIREGSRKPMKTQGRPM